MVSKTRRTPAAESSPSDTLRWSVEQRLAFIEGRLFWQGTVNRTDLVRRFGVSMSQASGDIARYLALEAPGVSYDKSAKRYVAGDAFRPALAPPNAAQFLSELRLAELGMVARDQMMLDTLPPFDTTPVPERTIDPLVLRAVLRAIRERRALDALYQSMSRPNPRRRVIEPHAIAHDGFRWHARAYDRDSREFRDFVLGRLSKAKVADAAGSAPSDDADWQTTITLVVAPHPKLTPAQAQAIAIDYAIRGGSTAIKVRRALLFYALKRLGLDVAPEVRPPHEQHIVLLNRDDVWKSLAAGRET